MTEIVKTSIDAFKVSKGKEKPLKIVVIVYELLGWFFF